MPFQTETEARAYFLNPFTAHSSYKWKFVVCPFVDKKQTGYPFVNGLNGLAHICLPIKKVRIVSTSNVGMHSFFPYSAIAFLQL